MNAKRKLLVTGGRGFVAGSVLAQAGSEWEVHATSRGEELGRGNLVRWHACDALDAVQLGELFLKLKPDVIIHTAAIADIDLAQSQPELARAVNVDFTRNLVIQCAKTGARLVFCSTDTVFDGEHAPYGEEDQPGPVNFYAETKVEAERIVSGLGKNGVIARLALVIGFPVFGAGNAFLPKMIAALKEGRTVAMSEKEIRTPLDAITAGRALLELGGGNYHGIFHLAGHSRLSRFEMARTTTRRFGFREELVLPQSGAPAGRAARPPDVSLSNAKACAQLQTPMRTLEEGLSLIIENMGKQGTLAYAAASR